jgi:hypothetical protein
MSYVINNYSGSPLVVLPDGKIDTTTSLGLVGRNYVGYGTQQNENFVYLLENFANNYPPKNPIKGQTWFQTNLIDSSGVLNVYDGAAWHSVGSASKAEMSPSNPTVGELWFKSPDNQLYAYDGAEWIFIGPESTHGLGVTRAKADVVVDSNNQQQAIVLLIANNVVQAIVSSTTFTLATDSPIEGFGNIIPGINVNANTHVKGNLIGLADRASKLETPRLINGISFDAQTDITIKAATPFKLSKGVHILGSDFDGSSNQTWSVDATANNVIGKIVLRDSRGDFSARVITADLIGNVTGNVTSLDGISVFDTIQANAYVGADFGGNAASASSLSPGSSINGVLFNGSQNITVPAEAGTLTGPQLSTSVIRSNLQSVGNLSNLNVLDYVTIGGGMRLSVQSTVPTLYFENGFSFQLKDNSVPGGLPALDYYRTDQAVGLGGLAAPTFAPTDDLLWNIGLPAQRFNNLYSKFMYGTASSAQYADLAENYLPDAEYDVGTVLIFGGEQEVTISTKLMDTAVAGVVSTNPAYLMNSELKGVAVALVGRVPCKVIGPIKKGEILITSNLPGVATSIGPISPYAPAGVVVGKALEDYKDNENVGIIEVVIGR